MDFAPSPISAELVPRVRDFVTTVVQPAEPLWEEQHAAAADPHASPAVMEELKLQAQQRGLWNLFLPNAGLGPGLSTLDYAPLAEISGHSVLAPEAMNCSAPDTGNMELLAEYGTEAQQRTWLRPLLDGTIRSCFAMTEPAVASSDATNIATTIRRDGDSYVINGHKWWITGSPDPRCRVAIVLGRTGGDDALAHRRHSMVLVPMSTPGVRVVRDLTVFGYHDQQGHGEVILEDVRVPTDHRIGEEGAGFAMAQARLGPGRIHHCMRAIGMAERVLEMMCRRALDRVAFGRPLATQGVIREWIADSRIEIEQARLLTLKTAWLMSVAGNRHARTEIAAIKVVAPQVACRVIDRGIQLFGAAGVSPDLPLSRMYSMVRTLRIADGPDEVHRRSIARAELARYTG